MFKIWIVGTLDALLLLAAGAVAAANNVADQPWWALVVVAPIVAAHVWMLKDLTKELRAIAPTLVQVATKLDDHMSSSEVHHTRVSEVLERMKDDDE